MVDVLVLDLGGTLVDGDQTLPHVKEALTALTKFEGSSGHPLQLALVSDFEPADPPTPAGIRARFTEYLRLLDGFGLRRFFHPVTRHVTLSTHAGTFKPDRRVYELALERLGGDFGLGDCLSITEHAGHVAACQGLGMRALRFGGDFTDWAEAPLLVRHQIDPTNAHNTSLALGVWLAATQRRKLVGLRGAPTEAGASLRVRPPGPAGAVVAFDGDGRVSALDWEDRRAAAHEDAAFSRSLRDHGQLAQAGDGPLPPGATHREASGEHGEPVVRRERFSAF